MTALADELPVHRDDPWYSKSQWPWWYLCEDVKRNWGAYLPITAKFFFYLSIKSRSFPSLWKKLNIVLIPKANDNRNPSNYWTIYLSASYLWSPTLLFPMIETLQLLCLMAVKWPFVHWWYAQIVQRSGITPGYKSYNIIYTPSQNDCLLIPSISM